MKFKHYIFNLLFFASLGLLYTNTSLFCQNEDEEKPENTIHIRNINIERRDVFFEKQPDWFFAAGLFNALHALTKEYIIEDELLFDENDGTTEDKLYETERNIRSTGLFSYIEIKLDSVGEDIYDVRVITQDRWSTRPSLLFGTGGNSTRLGGRLEELNLLGTGTRISAEGLYRNEFGIGWQGIGEINQRRLFESEYKLDFRLLANKFRTEELLTLQQPFRTLDTKYAFGTELTNNYGSDFIFQSDNNYQLVNFREKRVRAWFSRGWKRVDRVFVTVLMEMEDVDRGKPEFVRAFDNSGKVLVAFSSVSENYYQTNKLNTYQQEDVPIGGWGTAVLGKVFPVGHKGEGLYYIAGQGEKSVEYGNLYLFGQMTGASGFAGSLPKYTYEEFFGQGFYRFTNKLLAAARLRQQTVWNWDRKRQLILDNDNGLRGYSLNNLIGENRIVSNLEFRYFPDIPFWIFNISGVGFWDAGTVWKKGDDLTKTSWHNSVGFGFRLHDAKATGPQNIYRIDFAFNLNEKKFGEIIFSTDQLFSIFRKHEYKIPEIYGLEFDYK